MRRSNFALRVQKSLLEEARKLAEAEGVALNQFINVALAEKLLISRNGRAEEVSEERRRFWRERGRKTLPSPAMSCLNAMSD